MENKRILKAKRKNKNTLETYSSSNRNTEQTKFCGSKRKYDSFKQSLPDNQLNKNEAKHNPDIKKEFSSTFSVNDRLKNYKSEIKHNQSIINNSNASTYSHKYSANDRLRNYRIRLDERKNEVVRVHQAQNTLNCKTNKCEGNLNNPLHSSIKCSSILGKRPLRSENDKIKQSSDSEFQNKKIKITNDIEIIKTLSTNSNNTELSISNDDSKMDWSPIDEAEIITNIQKFRDNYKDKLHLGPDVHPFILPYNTSYGKLRKDSILYIVVDTNIFISHLSLIEDILSGKYREHEIIIYVPWIVFQELDYFKDGRSGNPVLLKTARRAIQFLNEYLMKKHKQLKGQTVQEALSQKEPTSNADDSIVFCCLNLAQTSKNVILLSNDINLRNKALINNIPSYGPKNIFEKIKESHIDAQNKQRVDNISSLLANTCTEIILVEMEEAYGSVLYKLIAKPPWDFKQCLVYIKRFWSPVFSLAISQKQCLKIIEDLLIFIQTHNDLATEKNMEEFIKLCLSLCVYFKNCLNKHRKIVKTCIDNIQKLLS